VSKIFICYRRDDSGGYTGRLHDALSSEFGPDRIFRDLDTIGPGDDFVQAISRGVESCAVFLAVVGRNWLTAADHDGRRRLDSPSDHVRSELKEALDRDVRVIPVLVQGASMPQPADLPDPLKPFADRNAIKLDDDDWSSDVHRLVEAIRHACGEVAAPRTVDATAARPRMWMAAAGVVVIAVIAFLLINRRGATEPSRSDAGAPVTTAAASPGTAAAGPPVTAAAAPQATSGAAPSSGSRPLPPASPGTAGQVTFPAGSEVGLGHVAYEILDASVTKDPVRVLNLRIRLINRAGYSAGFGDSSFRLRIDDEASAPKDRFSDVVPSESTKENTVSFQLPDSATGATLRVLGSGEAAEVPIDFNGRQGLTAAQERELRVAGKRTAVVPLDAQTARLRFGDVTCEVRKVSVHRYANKFGLTLDIRAQNTAGYSAGFGDGNFRLALDGTARAPISGVSAVIPPQSSLDSAIVFDVPLDAHDVVVRARFGETTGELPLKIPAIR